MFTREAILGFDNAAIRAVPTMPQVDLSVDISGANTDLPGPGMNMNSVWIVNPGGGSLRGIKSPQKEGARVTLKHGWIGTTTLLNNDVGPGVDDRPLLLPGSADMTLKNVDSIELVYIDTFWQPVSMFSGGSAPIVGDFKISAKNADHADPAGGTWYIMNATTALPAGETQLIALIGANRIDMRGRLPVIVGTHGDVSSIGLNDGVAVGSRRPAHGHSVSADGGHAHGGFQAVSPTVGTGGTGYTGGDRADVTITDPIGNHSHTVGVSTAPVDKPAYGVVGHGFFYGSGS